MPNDLSASSKLLLKTALNASLIEIEAMLRHAPMADRLMVAMAVGRAQLLPSQYKTLGAAWTALDPSRKAHLRSSLPAGNARWRRAQIEATRPPGSHSDRIRRFFGQISYGDAILALAQCGCLGFTVYQIAGLLIGF